ncbi:MAG TPA: hypothetical protein VM184_02040, partial [Gaiellaceae bacterium]|nr:hypothetical protein [Gaiellaceae bacterium]
MTRTTSEFSRVEIADYLRETFDLLGIVERQDALEALHERCAPQGMIDLVAERVPEGTRMTEMRVLWQYLGD